MNDFTGTQEGHVLTPDADTNLFHAWRAVTHRVQLAFSFQIDVSRNGSAEITARFDATHLPDWPSRLPRFFAPVSERTMPRNVCTS